MGTLRPTVPQFLAVHCLSQTHSPLFFIARCYGKSSSLYLCFKMGSPQWGLDPSLFKGISSADVSLSILNHHTIGVGPTHSASSPFLPLSTWFLLYILTHKNSVQIVFRYFSKMVILKFSCNFDVVMGGSKHSVYLLSHLEWKSLVSLLLTCFVSLLQMEQI